MARINNYSNDNNLEGTDKLVGTDSTGDVTKNFTLQKLTNFVQSKSFIMDQEENDFDLSSINTKYSAYNNGTMVLFIGISPVVIGVKVDNYSWALIDVNIVD